MDTEQEINRKIINITMTIHENYPELSKYLNEMPITIPDENDPHINLTILNRYYQSLVTIFRNYVGEHQFQNSNRNQHNHHL